MADVGGGGCGVERNRVRGGNYDSSRDAPHCEGLAVRSEVVDCGESSSIGVKAVKSVDCSSVGNRVCVRVSHPSVRESDGDSVGIGSVVSAVGVIVAVAKQKEGGASVHCCTSIERKDIGGGARIGSGDGILRDGVEGARRGVEPEKGVVARVGVLNDGAGESVLGSADVAP